ncbi:MAG: cytochrome P450 [Monoraphidium minutum]|nr:MAG: cytochrome P450 [Monoraphidium minutum]
MLADPLSFIESVRGRHGPVAGLLLGGERVVLVSCPAAARQVLIDRADIFVKEGTAFFPGSALTGNGLLVSDGDVWRRQRRLSNPAFRRAAVEGYAGQMAVETQRLLRGPLAAAAAPQGYQGGGRGSPSPYSNYSIAGGGGGGGVVDVYAEFNKLTLNITLAALFGLSADDEAEAAGGRGAAAGGGVAARVVAAVERAFAFFANRGAAAMVVPEWVPTPDNLEFGAAVRELDDLVYGIIRRRRAALRAAAAAQLAQQREGTAGAEGGGGGGGARAAPPDLLQGLLEAVDDDGSGLSDVALRDEAMTLLVAGQETSAILLGWAAALLAHHPAAQDAAAAEVAAALPPGRPPGAGDVAALPRVTGVVLEALRLYSPAYMVGRCASADVELAGGYRLPRGTTVLVSPYLLHRDPNHWEEPLRFKPERWDDLMRPSGDAAGGGGGGGYPFAAALREMGPNGAYVPFGGGPRNCIGAGFAMIEAVLVLAALLQRYRLAPPPNAGFPRPKALLTLRPDGVPVAVSRRT